MKAQDIATVRLRFMGHQASLDKHAFTISNWLRYSDPELNVGGCTDVVNTQSAGQNQYKACRYACR